jgi:hypothetical protein
MIKRMTMLLGFALLMAPAGLFAIPLTLVGPISGNTVGPQSASNPCIIAGTNCSQPAGFGYNNFTSNGSISSYNIYSITPTAQVDDGVKGTPYTVAQLTALGSTSFNIAIDVNTTSAAGETLQLLEVLQCTTAACTSTSVLYNYAGPTNIGGIANNGNGFADSTLNTVNLAGHASTDLILFHAVWNNASDGAESFFIVPTAPVNTPKPSPLLLLGAGIVGIGIASRKFVKA